MRFKTGLTLLLAATIGATTVPLPAATDITDEPGFSGFFTLGVGFAEAASNQVSIEGENDTIDSLESAPDSASTVIPGIGLSLTYTFDNLATELFLGDSIEDFVRFDFATVGGLRQRVEDVGIFEIVAVQTPFATDVWADPYLVDEQRDETEREVGGFRLQWGKILQSGFDLRVTRREADIGDERSGEALLAANAITASERELLDRNGDVNSARLTYIWNRGRGEQISLAASYLDYDLDGEAMAFDGYGLQLSDFRALSPRVRVATNLVLGKYGHNTANPIYGKKNEKELAALTLTLFLSDIFGFKGWLGNATLAYADEDNEIDFYDTTATYANVGLIRRF
jgi:hypothetical protein